MNHRRGSNFSRRTKKHRRVLRSEKLEQRHLMAADVGALHNADQPTDTNGDGRVSAIDALVVVNHLGRLQRAEAEGIPVTTLPKMVDVDNNGEVTSRDALLVINYLLLEGEIVPADTPLPPPLDYGLFPKAPGVDSNGVDDPTDEYFASFNDAAQLGDQNLLQPADVDTLLDRASAATSSDEAIIVVVDRNGTILGVRVEAGVDAALQADPKALAFAIDGAAAKARTAAFFSSNSAPLTSRTIRSLSQSTMTQRQIEASPVAIDDRYEGPGFVAPIGVGGKFPPEVNFTPQVDLFAIEHQSRDSQRHGGADGIKGNTDDFYLRTRFNGDPDFIPTNAESFFQTWPEAYGIQTETFFDSQSRGVATLPGGVPLFKLVSDAGGSFLINQGAPLSKSINLVGGIGVFFPGEDGYATHEQEFVHTSENGGVTQTELERTNSDLVLEAEFSAFIAAAGVGLAGPSAFLRDLSEFNSVLPPLPNFVLPTGRIDLVGITLEIYGPGPTRQFRIPGVDRLIDVGRATGPGVVSGDLVPVDPDGVTTLKAGAPVPEGWLIAPHDSSTPGGLTADAVDKIITDGIAEANRTRAAIRLNIDDGFRPGVPTGMVLAVTDTTGELLGLHRMPDATIFSIDVSIAKARNTAYYADATAGVLQDADRVDFNGDGVFGEVSTSLAGPSGDTLPVGTAISNRTVRFLVEPRYPTGIELSNGVDQGLVNDPNLELCDQKPGLCEQVAPQSILRTAGINPTTGENLDNNNPLSRSVYADPSTFSVLAFEAFTPSRNFRDLGDATVVINGSAANPADRTAEPLANQNGIVFFPGSSPLYLDNDPSQMVGGFGVSGDGVDQDDIVTFAGQASAAPPAGITVDQFIVGGVRLPFQKFNRNPFLL